MDHEGNRLPEGSIEATAPDREVGSPVPQSSEQAELSRKAQEMGESRKKAYSTLLELAKTSPEAKAQLLTLAQDEKEKSYLADKFGEAFTSLASPVTTTKTEIPDEVKVLLEERKLEREAQVRMAKGKLGITTDEEGTFDDLVSVLQSTQIGGKKITLAEAIEMAGKQLRSSLSATQSRSDVNEKPEDKPEDPIPAEKRAKYAKYLS
jgi:hypothetical protein